MTSSSLFAVLAELAVKGTAVLATGFLAVAVLARRSASARSWAWTLTFVALSLLPALLFVMPAAPLVPVPPRARALVLAPTPLPPPWPLPARPAFPTADDVRASATPTSTNLSAGRTGEQARRDLQRYANLLWIVGVALLLLRFVVVRIRAARLVGRAALADPSLWGQHAGSDIRASHEIAAPITAGVFRPVVVVPLSDGSNEWTVAWPAEARVAAVSHELAHVDRRDTARQALVDLVCALYWVNPLAWLAARRLRLDREIAADDAVLRSGVRSSDYASFLVALAARPGAYAVPGAIVPILTRKGLKARLLALLDDKTRHGVPSRPAIAMAVFGCGCLVALLATTGSSTTLAAARFRTPEVPAKMITHRDRVPTEAASGVLRGRVVDPRTGRPVVGASVDLLTDVSIPLDSTVTNRDGQYRFENLPRLFADVYGIYVRQGALAARHAMWVPRNTEGVLDVALDERGATVSGRVLGEGGRPIAGARVGPKGGNEKWWLHPGDSATQTTDREGRYRIEGVLPGWLDLTADAEGFASRRTIVAVAAAARAEDIHLMKLQNVEGVVVTSNGEPVRDAVISAVSTDAYTEWAGQTVSEADGSFLLRCAGILYVDVVHQGRLLTTRSPIPTTADAEHSLRVVVQPGAVVSGTVRWRDGAPAADVLVFATPSGTKRFSAARVYRTGSDGRYSVGPLAAGQQEIHARGGPPGLVAQMERIERVTGREHLTDADITLPAASP